MSESPARMVREYHEKFDLPRADVGTAPRWINSEDSETRRRILREEYMEYREAQDAGDVAAMAHEAADMICVLYGDAVTIGFDLDAAIAAVMAANMTKGPDVVNGKPVKGPGFQRANVAAAIGLEDNGAAVAAAVREAQMEAQPPVRPVYTEHRNVITGDPEMDEPGDWCEVCNGVDGHFPGCATAMSAHVRDLIRRQYGVPAEVGGRISYTYRGRREGTIVGFDTEGAYLLIRLDGEDDARRYHPTWEIEYLEATS